MNDRMVTDDEANRIRAAKRAVWAQQGAGDHYHYLVYQSTPVTRLKNLTELGFVLRQVSGPRILDAGAGTGRFTFPLQERGMRPVALDISLDMLRRAARHAAETRCPLAAVCGEIERLPFPSASFDGLVSVTVLRHFPQWLDILKEYLRVVRPGGRIVIDMASGDQQAYLAGQGIPSPYVRDGRDPLGFDAGVTVAQLERLALELGVTLVAATPHDFFNDNHLLNHVLGDRREPFFAQLEPLLQRESVLAFCELLTRRFLPALGPAVTNSLLIVLENTPPAASWRPPHRDAGGVSAGGAPRKTLERVLERGLGRRRASYQREAARLVDDPDVQAFLRLCEEWLLPRWPLDSLAWEAH